MSSPWRRAFSLRLLDEGGRLCVPWGWVLVGLLITAATVTYDLVGSPFPHWLDRSSATVAAQRFLARLPANSGQPAVDPNLPVAFVSDRYADAYANRLTAGKRGVPLPTGLPIWTWHVPLRQGRGYVAVGAATGEVVALDFGQAHVAIAAGGSGLDEAVAAAQLVGVSGSGWDGPTVRPGGRGTLYTWRSRDNVLGEAPELAEVEVRGSWPAVARRFVAVPAAFRSNLDAQEQRGNWVARGLLGWVELLATLAAAVLAILWRRKAHWTFGATASFVFLALVIIASLNASLIAQTLQRPLAPTGAIITGLLVLILVSQAARLLWLFFGGAAGWAMARETWGDRLALLTGGLGRLLGRDGAVAALRAYAVFVVQYQLAFWFYYLAEKRLGVWEATSLAFSQRLNLAVPALYPLQVVILAPLMEEVLWRLFAISALRRLFRFTFPAVLLPAVFWGLAHSWYQVYPPYTRAVELTLVGVVLGYAFIHWGLEVTIGSHLLYNALVTGMGVALVPLPSQRVVTLLSVLLFLLPALPVALQLWRQRGETPAT